MTLSAVKQMELRTFLFERRTVRLPETSSGWNTVEVKLVATRLNRTGEYYVELWDQHANNKSHSMIL